MNRSAVSSRLGMFGLIAFVAAAALLLGTMVWLRQLGRSISHPPPAPTAERSSPPRIVALSPAIAFTLKDLGLAGRIVGRHGFDLALDKSIPVCGDQSGIDYEALIRVRPTHVLTEWGSREIPPKLAELAAKFGWTLRDYTQLTLDDVMTNAIKLGREFAQSDEVTTHGAAGAPITPRAAFADLTRRMNAAWGQKHPPLQAGRILLLDSIDPPAALGPGSFHYQILERLGGTPALTTGKAYMTLDLEEILRLAPDGIILLDQRPPGSAPGPAPTANELVARLGRIGSLDVPAVRFGNIALIDDPFSRLPGTALLNVSEQMERILKAWAVKR